ncbi:CHAT domain-containing protein [Nonomuraea sp. NPDC049400]|uniref:CHAT domain-containing protein n=1 Tax=Nonomuraea sp. NPDC049400 TaxID=3364352 RepID=UPI0037993C55
MWRLRWRRAARAYAKFMIGTTVRSLRAEDRWLSQEEDEKERAKLRASIRKDLKDEDLLFAVGLLHDTVIRRRNGAEELDLKVAERLAWFHWFRYHYLPDISVQEVAYAFSLFRRIAEADPDLVPKLLKPLFVPDSVILESWSQEEIRWLARFVLDLSKISDSDSSAKEIDELARHTGDVAEHTLRIALRAPRLDHDLRALLIAALTLTIVDELNDAGMEDLDRLAAPLEEFVLESVVGRAPREPMEAVRLRFLRGEWTWPDLHTDLVTALAMYRDSRYLYYHPDGLIDDLVYALAYARLAWNAGRNTVPTLARMAFDPAWPRSLDVSLSDLDMAANAATDLAGFTALRQVPAVYRDFAAALARTAREIADRFAHLPTENRVLLASALLTEFDITGDESVLDRALAEARTALADHSPYAPRRLKAIGVLGSVLATVAEHRHDRDVLGEATRMLRDAVRMADRLDPDLEAVAGALIHAITVPAAWDNPLKYAPETAAELRELIRLLPDSIARDAAAATALSMDMLGYINRNDLAGLRDIRSALHRLVEERLTDHPMRDHFRLVAASSGLLADMPGGGLRTGIARFRRTLDEATGLGAQERAFWVTTLTSLMLQATATTLSYVTELRPTSVGVLDLSVIDECVEMVNGALAEVTAASDVHRSAELHLGWLFLCRYRETRERGDLDRAISLLGEPCPATADHVDVFMRALNLGEALAARFHLTGADADRAEAAALLVSVGDDLLVTPLVRLRALLAAGLLAASADRMPEALAALERGIRLSHEILLTGLERTGQEFLLKLVSGSVNEAAAAALRTGDAAHAVELLEEGRAVLIHQSLDVRGELAGLLFDMPDLGGRLAAITRARADATDAARRRELAEEWDELVAEIRARPGFSGFLRPPAFASVRPADDQTIVLINPAELGSSAISITGASIQVIALPELRVDDLAGQVGHFHAAIGRRVRAGDAAERTRSAAMLREVLDWLWRAVARPVLDALGHTGPPGKGREWPRIHWCPAGQLSFLPLHAATDRDGGPGASVLDRVVSSYIPSLRVLTYLRRRVPPPAEQRSLLIVSMPDTPGLPPLPGAYQESADLSSLGLPCRVLSGAEATFDSVRRALRQHAWVHFACHAGQDLRLPSRSRLFLSDHALRPLTVADVSRLGITYGELAFLSACETARGGQELPDEAIHLGGALMLAGYRHVIATLWKVKDAIAADVSAQVYRHLRAGEADLAPSRASVALHLATRALRERHPADPILWAPYVHMGP